MTDLSLAELQKHTQRMYGVDYPEGLRIATGLNSDPNGITQTLFSKDLNACYTELLGTGSASSPPGLLTNHALVLPGGSGNMISAPDSAALDILGDIDCRIECFITPASAGNRTFVSKWAAAGQRSYYFSISGFGQWNLDTTTAGTTNVSNTGAIFTAPGTSYNGAMQWVLDADNGAAGRTATYRTANILEGPYTLSETVTTAGTTTVFAGTAPLIIGARDAGGSTDARPLRVTRMELRNSAGTVVANPDFRNLAPGTTSFADAAGNTWTISGTARIV